MATIKGERRETSAGIKRLMEQAGYMYPADWPFVLDPAPETIEVLVTDEGLAKVAFLCTTSSGQYTVDWGDGNTTNHDSNTNAEHTYAIGTGQSCSRGYTTFKVKISGNLLSFKVAKHSVHAGDQFPGVVAAGFNSSTITSLSGAFWPALTGMQVEAVRFASLPSCTNTSSCLVNCFSLKFADCSGLKAVTNSASMFSKCCSLPFVDISAMTSLQSAGYMFEECCSLQNIATAPMASLTDAGYMFSYCSLLSSINESNFSAVTDARNMMYNCYNIQRFDLAKMPNITNANSMLTYTSVKSLDFSQLTNVTAASNMCFGMHGLSSANINNMGLVSGADGMFFNCYNLASLTSNTFGSSATSLSTAVFISNNKRLSSIDLSGAKLSRLGLSDTAVTTVSFHASSAFGGTSSQVSLSNNDAISQAQVETIISNLPSGASKSIDLSLMTNVTFVDKTCGVTSSSNVVTCTNTSGLSTGMYVIASGLSKNISVTFTDSTDVVTTTINHGFFNDDIVAFSSITTTTGISVYTPYYIVNAGSATFKLSATQGGAAINLVNDGSGTLIRFPKINSITPNTSFVISSYSFVTNASLSIGATTLNMPATGCKGWNVGW